MRYLQRTLSCAGTILLVGGSQAFAAGFMVRENSAESVATVFAGDASRSDDASTVFLNPAGMSQLQGSQFEVGATGVLPDIRFTGSASLMGNPVPGDNNRQMGQAAVIPHFYGMTELSDRLRIGLAVTVPFGNTVDNGNMWSGRYVDIKASALALDINPNISYQLTDTLSVGGGFSVQYLKLLISSGIAQFAILGPGTPDGEFILNTHSWALGYNFGLLYTPFEGTKLGIAYRSKIDQGLHGVLKFPAPTSPLLGLVTAPATAPIDLPSSITASLTQRLSDAFTFYSEVQFTGWHVFNQVAVVAPPNPNSTFLEKYRDSWMGSVGINYKYDDTWSLRGGLGVDQSPVVDAYRDTGVPDGDRFMVGIGPSMKLDANSSIDLAYSYYFGVRATMDKSVNAIDPTTGLALQGSYKNALNYLAISYKHAF